MGVWSSNNLDQLVHPECKVGDLPSSLCVGVVGYTRCIPATPLYHRYRKDTYFLRVMSQRSEY